MRSVQSDDFYAEPEEAPRVHPLVALADPLWRLGLVLFAAGFVAVFIDQAPFLLQVVLGAPIFEEALKAGLAILITARARALRLPVAWLVGAGFGVLEHYVTYSEESVASLVLRIAFHAYATGLTASCLTVLESGRDVRVRWIAPLPAIVLHYVNNVLAVVLGVASLAIDLPDLRFGWAITLAAGLGSVVVLVRPWPLRRLATRLVAHWPGQKYGSTSGAGGEPVNSDTRSS